MIIKNNMKKKLCIKGEVVKKKIIFLNLSKNQKKKILLILLNPYQDKNQMLLLLLLNNHNNLNKLTERVLHNPRIIQTQQEHQGLNNNKTLLIK